MLIDLYKKSKDNVKYIVCFDTERQIFVFKPYEEKTVGPTKQHENFKKLISDIFDIDVDSNLYVFSDIVHAIITKIDNNMTINEFKKILEEDPTVYCYQNGLNDIITNPIAHIEFNRTYDNDSKNFDFINVQFNLIKRNRNYDDLKVLVKKNIKQINKILVLNIKDKLFKLYGITVNCLKVDDIVITKDCMLLYKLSLKNF